MSLQIDGKVVKLQIWDTAGQERFHNITTSYYRGAHCIMGVYDVTNEPSFDHLNSWMEQIKTYGTKDVQVLVVGNKCDLTEHRRVTFDVAEEFSRSMGLEIMETSAKDNINVDQTFTHLATRALEIQVQQRNSHRQRAHQSRIKLEHDNKKQSKGCC